MKTLSNDRIAETLRRTADLLDRTDGNAYRARSYRRAAETVAGADRPMAELLEADGIDALKDYPGIGEKLADSIREIAETGRFGLLDRLESQVSPEQALAEVPGVGETLAERIHEQLGIESLAELERAAHDGRLEGIEGIGPEKARGIADALAGMLSRSARRRAGRGGQDSPEAAEDRPDVGTILDVDAEYRRKAEAGELKTIAPRRFNPSGQKWLPILNTRRDGWSFTALYSNTPRAHQLGKTDDWVVIYYHGDGEESQNTVVTATSGKLSGLRVVRGRESQCRRYYGR